MANLKRATNAVSQEDTEDPRFQLATEGLYRHPDSGAELAVFADPITGNAQAQGLLRVGFVRVGDVPTGYDKTVIVNHDFASEAAKGPVVATEDAMKGLLARVKQLEDEKNVAEAEKAKENDKSSENVDELQTDQIHAVAAENVATRLENTDQATNDNATVNQKEVGVNEVTDKNKTNKKESK